MIEFVTIHTVRDTFYAHYIGAARERAAIYRCNETDVSRLPEFVDLLLENGFTEFQRAETMGLLVYKRTGNVLAGGA